MDLPYRWGPKACGYSWTTTGHGAPHFCHSVGDGGRREHLGLPSPEHCPFPRPRSQLRWRRTSSSMAYGSWCSTALSRPQCAMHNASPRTYAMRAQHDKVRVVAHSSDAQGAQAVALLGPGEAPSPPTTHPERSLAPSPQPERRLLMSFTSARQPSSRRGCGSVRERRFRGPIPTSRTVTRH